MKTIVQCPLCEGEVHYINNRDYWECDNCGTEIWPGTTETKDYWKQGIKKTKLGVRITEKIPYAPKRSGSGPQYTVLRFEVFKRDNFTCVYCGRNPDKDGISLEIDHVMPVVDGGRMEMDNLVTACEECNHGKGSIPLSMTKRVAIKYVSNRS